ARPRSCRAVSRPACPRSGPAPALRRPLGAADTGLGHQRAMPPAAFRHSQLCGGPGTPARPDTAALSPGYGTYRRSRSGAGLCSPFPQCGFRTRCLSVTDAGDGPGGLPGLCHRPAQRRARGLVSRHHPGLLDAAAAALPLAAALAPGTPPVRLSPRARPPVLRPLSHASRLGLGQRRAEPAPTVTAGADLSRLRRRGDRAVLPDPPAGRLLSPPARPPSRSLPGLA